jgi:hypothetical protein
MVGNEEFNVVASSIDAEAITNEPLGKVDPPEVSKSADSEQTDKLVTTKEVKEVNIPETEQQADPIPLEKDLEDTEPLDAPAPKMVDPEPAGGRTGLAKETDPVGTDPEIVDGAGTEVQEEIFNPVQEGNQIPSVDLAIKDLDKDLEEAVVRKTTSVHTIIEPILENWMGGSLKLLPRLQFKDKSPPPSFQQPLQARKRRVQEGTIMSPLMSNHIMFVPLFMRDRLLQSSIPRNNISQMAIVTRGVISLLFGTPQVRITILTRTKSLVGFTSSYKKSRQWGDLAADPQLWFTDDNLAFCTWWMQRTTSVCTDPNSAYFPFYLLPLFR